MTEAGRLVIKSTMVGSGLGYERQMWKEDGGVEGIGQELLLPPRGSHDDDLGQRMVRRKQRNCPDRRHTFCSFHSP